MKIRNFNIEKDLKVVNQWWKDWDVEADVSNLLSSDGYIVEEDNKDLCAAWLYETNSFSCIIGWFISDKNIKKSKRDESISLLIDYIENVAKEKGYLFSIVYSNIDSMVNRLESKGYVEGDRDVKNLLKIL